MYVCMYVCMYIYIYIYIYIYTFSELMRTERTFPGFPHFRFMRTELTIDYSWSHALSLVCLGLARAGQEFVHSNADLVCIVRTCFQKVNILLM